MTNAQIQALPPLCRRRDMLDMGLTDEVLEAVRFEIQRLDDRVPPRRIGYLRLPSSRTKSGQSPKGFYRKDDALPFIGIFPANHKPQPITHHDQ